MAKKNKRMERVEGKLSRDELRAQIKRLEMNPDSPLAPEVLLALVESAARPGEDLAWLAAFDLDPEVASGAFLTMFYALESNDLTGAALDRFREQARPILLNALQSAGVPDDRKYSLGPLYAGCGGQVSDVEYRGFFKDFDAVSERALHQTMAQVTSDPRGVDAFLTVVEALDDGETPVGARLMAVLEVVKNVAKDKPETTALLASAALMKLWSEDVPEPCTDAVLQCIADTQCPEAAWCLAEMGRWPGIAPLDAKAQRLANKLGLMGIKPAYSYPARFSHAMLTAPDGVGSRQLLLFFLTPDGGMDAVFFLLNDLAGMKDANCLFDEGSDIDEDIRLSDDGILYAQCSMELAREILADVWAFHHETRKPMPPQLFVFRPYLGEEPIVPRRRTPDLSAYRLDTRPLGPELFIESETLAESYYEEFSFASDHAYEFIASNCKGHFRNMPKKVFDRFLSEVAIEDKGALLERMAATLEVEALAGRAQFEENLIAASTWLGMKNDVQPFHTVPFIHALGKCAVARIGHNLRMGFRSQAEANAAAMAENELDEAWDEEYGEDEKPF